MFKIFKKTKVFIVILVFVIFFIFIFSRGHIYDKSELEYGLTFSKKQMQGLGLDWQAACQEILDDLQVKKLRLPAYWDEIQTADQQFNWQDLDWQIEQASKRNVEIILAIGGRLPRWPECHFPAWTQGLSADEREDKILAYLQATIERYKNNPQISAWQIENEPFLSHFGDCPKLDKNFLDAEITRARALDSRPLIITDSGELSTWIPAARRADIFGTSLYRDTYSRLLKSYIHYPISPGFFRLKKNIANFFAHPQKWIIIELQAEPWGPVSYQNLSQADRDRTMNLEKFKAILEFARQAGFREFYLWGVEWWYWEREVNHNPELWEEAKKLFR